MQTMGVNISGLLYILEFTSFPSFVAVRFCLEEFVGLGLLGLEGRGVPLTLSLVIAGEIYSVITPACMRRM